MAAKSKKNPDSSPASTGPATSGADAGAPVIKSLDDAKKWLARHKITEIESLVPDQAGVARGKIMPTAKFLQDPQMALPSAIFMQTISGEWPEEDDKFQYDPRDGDIELTPVFSTLCVVPWARDPTAQVIHDAFTRDGRPLDIAPRQVLKRIVDLYAKRGWNPVVAPEIEFYLVEKNTDPDYPLRPPVGRSGRPEAGRRSYSISAVNEFDDLFEQIYDYCEAQGLDLDTLIHEEGAAQMEINLLHGDPLWLADQVFLLKRTIREAALQQNIYATFMAKPIASEPGSAMHIHQSVVDAETGRNIFSDPQGRPTQDFFHFIAGQQKYLPAMLCVLAPYVNSYRRLVRQATAPVNVHWGYDNRTTGIRVPPSGPDARRVENRLPSSDANPYLAIAASLAAGWLGIEEALQPSEPLQSTANTEHQLPRSLLESVALFEETEELREVFGDAFINTYAAIKKAEFETFMRVISPWEREFLLLNV